jgi:hypothetical protein
LNPYARIFGYTTKGGADVDPIVLLFCQARFNDRPFAKLKDGYLSGNKVTKTTYAFCSMINVIRISPIFSFK